MKQEIDLLTFYPQSKRPIEERAHLIQESDRAKFKVPTLRNVELTAPYMHDGSMEILEEIILNYESGGKDYPNKSGLIEPFTLTETERNELVLFLKTLTDESFINNPLFKN